MNPQIVFYSKRRRGDRLFPSGHNIGYTSLRAIPPSPLTLESNTSKGLPHPLNTTNQEIVYNSMRAFPHADPRVKYYSGVHTSNPPFVPRFIHALQFLQWPQLIFKLEAINH